MNVTHPIHPLDVILHKRDGLVLSEAEIRAFISAVVDRTPERQLVTDAQIAAFLMAVFQRGLNPQELATLTDAMRFSGETFNRAELSPLSFLVDKHSTGGVGDKTSLLIAPILAAAGLASLTPEGSPSICVPMISGRSLGHTGGTLDKLETIPGFDTQLPLTRFAGILRQCGASLIGQTPAIVPADRVLYALRDHTGTIESPFLITASIMSKKLAESLDGLVLDVKTGSGAFMRKYDDARFLAELMVSTGTLAGTRTVALLTSMDQPLGRYSGNWVEVLECVDIMQGRRHPLSRDLIELTNILSGWMLFLAGHVLSPEAGAAVSNDLLASGQAFQAFLKIVDAHGGDIAIFDHPEAFHKPAASRVLRAPKTGYLASMDCTEVGWAVQRLGAGRVRPGDPVSAHAGLEVHTKLGDHIAQGEPWVTLFADDPARLDEPEAMLQTTLHISSTPPLLSPLVREVIQTSQPQP